MSTPTLEEEAARESELDAILGERPITDEDGRRYCQYVDPESGAACTEPLPDNAHVTRRFCVGHQRGGHLLKKAKADKAPRGHVNVTVKPPSPRRTPKGDDVARVVGAVNAYLGLAAKILKARGDEQCATTIGDSAQGIAESVGEIARYHPGIAKMLAPVEATGEAAAWIGLLVAVSPVIVAILAHHELLPQSVADKVSVGVAVTGAVATMTNATSTS